MKRDWERGSKKVKGQQRGSGGFAMQTATLLSPSWGEGVPMSSQPALHYFALVPKAR